MPSIVAGASPIPGAARSQHRSMDMRGGGQWIGQGVRTEALARGGAGATSKMFTRMNGAGSSGIAYYGGLNVNRLGPDTRWLFEGLMIRIASQRPAATFPDFEALQVLDGSIAFDMATAGGTVPTTDCGISFVSWAGVLANVNPLRQGDARTAGTSGGFGVSLRHTGQLAFVITTRQGTGAPGGIAIINLAAQHGVAGRDFTKFNRWRFEFRQPTPTADGTVRFYFNGTRLITVPFGNTDPTAPANGIVEPQQDIGHSLWLPVAGCAAGAGVTMYVESMDEWSGPDIGSL